MEIFLEKRRIKIEKSKGENFNFLCKIAADCEYKNLIFLIIKM